MNQKKWEYEAFKVSEDIKKMRLQLNVFGENGWKLSHFIRGANIALFMREKIEKTEAMDVD